MSATNRMIGPVTHAIYSTIAIAWMIAWTISCIVIAVIGPFASVNAPGLEQYSTSHYSMTNSRNRNSWVNHRCDWILRWSGTFWGSSPEMFWTGNAGYKCNKNSDMLTMLTILTYQWHNIRMLFYTQLLKHYYKEFLLIGFVAERRKR